MSYRSTPKCLVVIPCLNEEEHIGPLIEQMAKSVTPETGKIIVADGGSSDQTINIIKNIEQKFETVSYLHNPGKIQSCAINKAVETYGGNYNWLIRVDAHCLYDDRYIEILIEEAYENSADSVVVSLQTQGKRGFQKAVAAAQNSLLGNGGSKHRSQNNKGEWVDHGHHALISLKAFRDIGGYDENFSHNEDAELDARLIKPGYRIWLTHKTAPIYFPRKTPLSLARQYFFYGRGRFKTFLKHRVPLKFRQCLPLLTLPATILALLLPLHKIFALPALIWASLCLFYGFFLGLRDKDAHTFFFSGIAGMTMHLSWAAGFATEFVFKEKIKK